jgi:hypothetical protein
MYPNENCKTTAAPYTTAAPAPPPSCAGEKCQEIYFSECVRYNGIALPSLTVTPDQTLNDILLRVEAKSGVIAAATIEATSAVAALTTTVAGINNTLTAVVHTASGANNIANHAYTLAETALAETRQLASEPPPASADSRPYKVFTGHISQEGISAPFVFSTSENTITGLSFRYFGVGYFGIDLDNPSGKRLWVTVGILPNAGGFASTYQDDPSVKIILAVRRNTGEYANSALNKTPIEIRVYN